MKWITVYPTMHCNNYCVYCGSRAVDQIVIEKRNELGLSSPPLGLQQGLNRPPPGLATRVLVQLGLRAPEPPLPPPKKSDAFTLNGMKELLQEQRHRGVDGVRFQGGEPTIWPELPAAVAVARELGFKEVVVVSNGNRLANSAYAEELLTSGLTGIVLSLLGYDAATHDSVTLVPGSFDQLCKGFQNCVQLRDSLKLQLNISSNIVVSGENFRQLPTQIELLADLGVNNATLHLLRYHHFGNDDKLRKRFSFPLHQLREPLAAAFALGRQRGVTIQAQDIPLCQHPTVNAEALANVLARSADLTVVHSRPGRSHQLAGEGHRLNSEYLDEEVEIPHETSVWMMVEQTGARIVKTVREAVKGPPPAHICEQCLFQRDCPRAPDEYMADGPKNTFRPIHLPTFLEQLKRADTVTSADDAAACMRELAEGGLLTGELLQTFQQEARAAFERQVHRAVEQGQELEAVRALHGLLELEPQREYRTVGIIERVRGLAPPLTPRFASPRATRATPPQEFRLVFAHGHSIGLVGWSDASSELELSAIHKTQPAGVDPLVHAVFTEHLLCILSSVRGIRVVEGRLEGDRNGRWIRLLRAFEPRLLMVEGASAGAPVPESAPAAAPVQVPPAAAAR